MLEDTELVWVSLTEGMGVLDWVRGLYSRLGGPVGYGVFFFWGGGHCGRLGDAVGGLDMIEVWRLCS